MYGFTEAMMRLITVRFDGACLIRSRSRPNWTVSSSVAPKAAAMAARRFASVGRGLAGRAAGVLAIR